jgi:hypothetical protein
VLLFVAAVGGAFGQQTLFRQTGSLGNGDARSTDGGFVDQFAVPVGRESRVAVLVVSVDFLPKLEVAGRANARDAEFRGFGSAYATVFSQDADTLTIRISGNPGDRGAYTARVYELPTEPRVFVSDEASGFLDSSDEVLADGRYIDWYPLSLDAGDRVTLVAAADFDSYLIVEYPNGRRAENDDWADTDAGMYVTAARDSVLLVGVTSLSEQTTGGYTLSIRRAPRPPEISIGESVNGSLTESDSDGGVTADRFLLRGDEGTLVRIRLESDDFDTYLVVADGFGGVLENDDAPDGTRNSELTYAFTDDTVLEITARAFDDTERGDYRLQVTEYQSDYPLRQVPDGYELSNGERVFTVFTASDNSQRFTFRAGANRNISFFAESDSFDAVLEITTPTGSIIRDDDSGGGTNPLVQFITEEGGVYSAVVSSYSGAPAGPFTVGFDLGAEARVIARISGQLEQDDALDISGRRYDEYDIDLKAGQEVTIDASSLAFDTYLYLRDPEGVNVAENDDGPMGGDAQIVYRAPKAGIYSIVVTSYSAGGAGEYRLLVTESTEG